MTVGTSADHRAVANLVDHEISRPHGTSELVVDYQGHSFQVGDGEASKTIYSNAGKQIEFFDDEKLDQLFISIEHQISESPRAREIRDSWGFQYGELTKANQAKIAHFLSGGSVPAGAAAEDLQDITSGGANSTHEAGGHRTERLPTVANGIDRKENLSLAAGGMVTGAVKNIRAISSEGVTSAQEAQESNVSNELGQPKVSNGESRNETLSFATRAKNAFIDLFDSVRSALGGLASSIAGLFGRADSNDSNDYSSKLDWILQELSTPKEAERESSNFKGIEGLVPFQTQQDLVRGHYTINDNKYSNSDSENYASVNPGRPAVENKTVVLVNDLLKACGGNKAQLFVVAMLITQRTPAAIIDGFKADAYTPKGSYDHGFFEKVQKQGKSPLSVFAGGKTINTYAVRTQNDGSILLEVIYRKENIAAVSLDHANMMETDPEKSWFETKIGLRVGNEKSNFSVTLAPLGGVEGAPEFTLDSHIVQADD